MAARKSRNTTLYSDSIDSNAVILPEKIGGFKPGYIQRTHSDLRADPKYQRESERFLTWLAENQGAYEKITGGLVKSDMFETIRDEEGRLGTAVDRARIMRDAPEDIKETYKYLSEEFVASKAGNFGEILKATWDRGIDLIADPINLAFAIVAPGVGSAATKASTAAAQKVLTSPGGKAAAQKTLRNIAAANTGKAAAFEGSAWTGIENFYRQDKNISLGIQDSFSKGDFALATGAGLALGGGLGYGFGRVFSSTPSLIDNVNNSSKVAPKRKISFDDPETPKPEKIEHRKFTPATKDALATETIETTTINWGPVLDDGKPRVRTDGTPVFATSRLDDNGNFLSIDIDDVALRKSFDSKPWTESKVFGVRPLKANDIQSPEEWIMFNLFHERNHASTGSLAKSFGVDEEALRRFGPTKYKASYARAKAAFENGANIAALKDLKIWRETQEIEELVPFTFTAGTARDQQTGKFIKNKIDATLSNTFNKAKLSVNPTTGQSYYNRSLNPEVDTNLLNRIVTGLKDKDKNIIVMLPEADASNMILAIKDIIIKQGDEGAEIGLNTIAPKIQTAVKDYNFNDDQLKRLVDEIGDTYFPARKQIVDGKEGIFQPRLSDNDMRDLSNQLANDIGGSSKNTGSILYDKLNNINSNPNYNSLQVKDSIASAAYAQTQKYLGSSIGGFIKAANILNPARRFGPNVMSFLQRSFNSEMNESWKTGSVVIRDTNDFNTYFNRRFGSWETPWKKAYDGIKQTAKGPQREKIDELISNAIRTGSKRGLNTVKFATPEAKKAVVESIDILQKNFADIGREGSDKGLLRNLSANYLPRLWMRDKIISNRESFIDLVVSKNGVKGINDRVEADNWIEELLDIKYQFGNENGFGGNSFFANRKLDIGDETIFNDFLDTDLDRVTKGYFSSAAKAFAKKDILGVRNAEEFDRLWHPAIEKEMKLNGANGAQILGGKKNASYLYKNITGEGLERFGPKTQFAADAYMLANQMAFLPLGTLSSITEIFLNMSKAGIGTSMRGFRDATMNGSKKIYDDSMDVLAKVHGMTSAESKYEMKMMGIAVDQAAADEMQRIAGNELSNATMRKISNRFFKLNLLDQWTRFVQLTSYITGKRVITETIETLASKAALINKGQISKRTQIEIDQLASLGINYKDGIKWYNGGAKLEDAFYTKIKQGGGTYTDGVILTPSSKSGLKPAYMNHPQTAILGQLLGYPAAFSNVVLKGMFKQIARDPQSLLTHHIPAVAMMTGVAALANGIRTNGEAWKDKENFEITRDAIFRWGGNGLLIDMFSRGRDSAKYYQNLSGYVAGTGVVQGDVFNLITQGSPFSWFVGKAPGTGAVKAIFEPFEATEDFPENIREFGKAGDDLLKDLFLPERDRNAKGGIVDNVAQVTEEPDERIDRMTGLPYNLQAGGAFVDEEDRQEFMTGGVTKAIVKGGTSVIKGLWHGSPTNPSKLSITKTLDQNKLSLGRGVYVTPDEKKATKYLELEPFKNEKGKRRWKEERDVGATEQRWRDERLERGGDEPTLLEIEAHIDDGEIIRTGTKFADQPTPMQTKINAIAKDYDIQLSDKDKDSKRIFYILYKKIEDRQDIPLTAETIFKNYGIKAAKRDLRGTSLEGLSKGGDEEYAFYDDSILKIIKRTSKPRQEFAAGTVVSKAVPVLKSALDEALDFLANKGENITVSRLSKSLSKRGVRKDEQKSSGITELIEKGKVEGLNKLPRMDEIGEEIPLFTTTRKGNTAITPEGLKTLKETRLDRSLVDSNFVSAKESGVDRLEIVDPNEGSWGIKANKEELVFPRTFYDRYTPGDVNELTLETIIFRDPRVDTRTKSSAHFKRGKNLNLPKDSPTYGFSPDPYTYHARIDIDEHADIDTLRVLEMQTDLDVDNKQRTKLYNALIYTDKWDDMDVDGLYDVMLSFNIDEKNIKFSRQESKEISKVVKDYNAAIADNKRIHKVFDTYASKPQPGVGKSGIYPERFKTIMHDYNRGWIDKPALINELKSYVKNEKPPEELAHEIYNYFMNNHNGGMWENEILSFIQPTLKAAFTVPLPSIDVSQNLINRMIAETKERGLSRVSFLIGKDTPKSTEYMGLSQGFYGKDRGHLVRSVEVQKTYSTTVESQVKKIAKKIGATTSWDEKGYLILDLPEKDFTLPMFKNQGGSVRDQYGVGSTVKKKVINAVGKLFGIGPREQRDNEKAAIAAVNQAVENKKLPDSARIPTDVSGLIDNKRSSWEKLGSSEEVFNAINHGLLSYRYGTNPVTRAALQVKEKIQGSSRENPISEEADAFNNHFGYTLRERGLNEQEALQEMVNAYDRTNMKLMLEQPLIQGQDLIFNVNDLQGSVDPQPETLGQMYTGRIERNKGGKVLNSLHRNCA